MESESTLVIKHRLNPTWSFLIALATAVIVLAAGTLSCASPSVVRGKPLDVGPQVGKLAPAFSLKDANGKIISLGDLKGKPVMINFWATW